MDFFFRFVYLQKLSFLLFKFCKMVWNEKSLQLLALEIIMEENLKTIIWIILQWA